MSKPPRGGTWRWNYGMYRTCGYAPVSAAIGSLMWTLIPGHKMWWHPRWWQRII